MPFWGKLRVGVIAGLALAAAAVWWCWPQTYADLEQRALRAVEVGDLSNADRLLRQLHRRRPRDESIHQALGDIAFQQGRPRDGLAWLERAAESSPQPAEKFASAGARALSFFLPDEAERLDRRAISANPAMLSGYSALARLALITHRSRVLRDAIAEADAQRVNLTTDPVLIWLWMVGDRGQWSGDEAAQWLREAVRINPDDAQLAAALARLSMAPRTHKSAEELWSSPRARRSEGWPLRLVHAEAEWQLGHWDEAGTILRTLDAQADDEPRAWLLRGELVAATGNAALALALAEEALRQNPVMVEAAMLRGQLLARMDRPAESASQLARAAQMDQLVQRALQLMQQPEPDIREALAAAQLAADLDWTRWAELVCQWIERKRPDVVLPASLSGHRQKPASRTPLSMPPRSAPQQIALRKRFDEARWSFGDHGSLVASDTTGSLHLTEVTSAWNLDFHYEYGHAPERWLMETLGGGLAVLDYDQDGCPDLFFAQAGKLSVDSAEASFQPCQMFRNHHGERFANVSAACHATVTGYFHGCVTGDFNEDGFVDLCVCGYGFTVLLWNQGDGTWHDGTLAAGIGTDVWTTSGASVDLDGDGDLDLYLAAYCTAPLTPQLRTCRAEGRFASCRPNAYPPAGDILWENLGDGRFADRSAAAGVRDESGYGLGVIAADFDNDGRSDVFVGNDTTPNFLFWNQGQPLSGPPPALIEGGLAAGVGVDGTGRAEACMGIACGDIDGNGYLDLFVTNFHDETCTLYVNHGQRMFEDRTEPSGLSNAGRALMGWGTQFVDLNADGWLDVVIVNGSLHDTPQWPQIYRNAGGRFVEHSTTAGDFFQRKSLGRAVAVGDFDGDGCDDLAVSHQTGPATLLRNDGEHGSWVRLDLVGMESPRDATGALIRARIGDRVLVRHVSRQGGYLTSCSPTVTLGLGTAMKIDDLEIVWPNGHSERQRDVAAGSRWLIREGRTWLPVTPPHE